MIEASSRNPMNEASLDVPKCYYDTPVWLQTAHTESNFGRRFFACENSNKGIIVASLCGLTQKYANR